MKEKDKNKKHRTHSAVENEERNRALLNAVPDLMFIFDKDFSFIDYKADRNEDLLMSPELFLNRKVSDVLPPNLARLTEEKLRLVFETGEPQKYEYELEINSVKRYFESRIVPLGKDKAMSIIREITDFKDALNQLKASRERYRILVENVSEAILLIKGDYIEYINPRGIEILGYSRDDLSEMPFLSIIHPNDRKIASEQYEAFKKGENVRNRMAFKVLTKYRVTKWVEFGGVSIFWEGSNALLGFFSDITKRKRAEEKVSSLLREQETLLRETHHRIKNNMGTIFSLLYLQAMKQPDENVQNIILDCANRVQSMMILYDKLYRSQKHDKLSVRDFLGPLLDEIINVSQSSRIVRTEIQIDNFALNANILSPLGIILNELISNSMKHAFTGPDPADNLISVSVKKKNRNITVIYRDNGCGIPSTVSVNNPSTFGLQLVKSLIDQIRGSLSVENDKGANFTINILI